MSDKSFPTTARVVIVGGGVMGCGLAYHLAHEGWSDVVLLEKAELTSGSTWHAAGQITHSTSSYGLGKCVDYNIGLYSGGLEAETGVSVTWHGCGSFRLAYTDDEMDWLRHTMSVGRALGFPIELVGPEDIRKHHPFYNLDGVRRTLHARRWPCRPVRRYAGTGSRCAGQRRKDYPPLPRHKHHGHGKWRMAGRDRAGFNPL